LNFKLLGKNKEIIEELVVSWDMTLVDELEKVSDGFDWSFGEAYHGGNGTQIVK
jgi:hypothetical protein